MSYTKCVDPADDLSYALVLCFINDTVQGSCVHHNERHRTTVKDCKAAKCACCVDIILDIARDPQKWSNILICHGAE